MKLPSKTLCLVVASAALVLAGCSKKPVRPNPGETMIGPTPGGSSSLNPMDMGSLNPSADLAPRDTGFDPSTGQNRQALKDQTVYFDFDKSDIKASERPKLQIAKDYLDKNPGQRLLLEGHCDWRGTAEYNLALGDRRANSVKKYLLTLGVSGDRVETLSKGSLEASKNADDATMRTDRRVDLIAVQPTAAGALPTAGMAAPAPMGTAPAPKTGGL